MNKNIMKVSELNINDKINLIDKMKINNIDVEHFKYKGLKGEYAVLEYQDNKFLFISPLHIIELIKNVPHIRFML